MTTRLSCTSSVSRKHAGPQPRMSLPKSPQVPPTTPPPKSPVASQSSVREEKAKLPSSPSYITAPGACGRACGPYCASSYSTCYFFLLLYHFLLIRHALRLPLRQMLAGSPAMQFWFSPSLPLSLSLSFLKWPVGLDQVRPGQTRRRQWREDPRPCPEGGSNYITVLAVDGLSSKVCLPDCRAPPPCQLGLGGLRCAMEPREGTWSVACQQVPGTSGGSLWLTACRVGA